MKKLTERFPEVLNMELDCLAHLSQLLKEEQQLILDRRTEPLMILLTRIEEELQRIREYQIQRDEAFDEILPDFPHPQEPGLTSRVSQLPEKLRDQTLEIARRIDVQVMVVHELTWQNHVLLSRSIHFLEQVLAPWLNIQTETVTTYSKSGTVQKGTKKATSLQAVA